MRANKAAHIAILGLLAGAALIGAAWPGCLVDEVCYEQADCPRDQSCFSLTGRCSAKLACYQTADCPVGMTCLNRTACIQGECLSDEDCTGGRLCVDGLCKSTGPLDCPSGMVPVEDSFCIDAYEASRPDATEVSAGTDNSMATSRPDVIPWQVPADSNGLAEAACEAAGKRLCTETEWRTACRGPADTEYAYGDVYEPATCNGIDTFCDCDEGPCAGHDPCPYAGCFHDCSADTAFRLFPTGSARFAGCTNAYGVFDMNGNVWEHVLDGDDTRIRGGAFNCSDSRDYQRCDYVPTSWKPSAKGFRCCQIPGGD